MKTKLQNYTRSQLALKNGHDNDEIWVAYNGTIYDLSSSRMWSNGTHYEHWAGQDLSDELPEAPHDEKVFTRFLAIGTLID